MNALENEKIALKWFEAFNTKNLDDLLSLYDDNAVHYSPKLKIREPQTNGFVKGKVEMHAWWKGAFERLSNLQYQVSTLTANNTRIFMEYVRKVEGEEDMLVAEVLEIKNNLIIASRVYHG